MLIISLMILCLSPFTAISVHSLSMPSIVKFEYFIDEIYNNNKASKRITLRCITKTTPAPRITFLKDGVILTNNQSNVERVSQQEIMINNVTYNNGDGVYRCAVSNKNGETFQEREIKIPTVGEFLPGMRLEDGEFVVDVTLGSSKRIYCPRHTYSYPLQYKWLTKKRRYEFIKENSRIHLIAGGKVLLYTSITQEDVDYVNSRGGISCGLQIGSKLALSKRFKFKPDGKAANSDSAPVVVEDLPANQYVIEGKNVELKCVATGSPIPSVKWFKDGVQINVNDSMKYENTKELPERLKLLNVRADMQGEYKCRFENKAGHVSSFGNIHVARSPKIKRRLPHSVSKFLKKELRLFCDAEGTGPLKYNWFRNGSQLITFYSDKGSIIIDNGILTITNVSYNDQGMYQCLVTSKYGQDTSVSRLIVKQPSGGITGNKSTNNNGNNNSTKLDKPTEEDNPLDLKYIILIACGGTVVMVLSCGAIFLYCRSKKDNKQEQFIPTPKPGYNGYKKSINGPIYAKPDFPDPPNHHISLDDDLNSTLSGAKMNDPEFISLMATLRSEKLTPPSDENFYSSISNGQGSITPSTEL